jgi:hypothetical protein
MTERERRLDNIRQRSDRLYEVAHRYSRLKWMAEQDASDLFLVLTEAAGDLSLEKLKSAGDLLYILWRARDDNNA